MGQEPVEEIVRRLAEEALGSGGAVRAANIEIVDDGECFQTTIG